MDFKLRRWELSDIPSVARYANNKNIADCLRDAFVHPYTEADAAAFVRSCMEAREDKALMRAIEIGNEAAGSIAIFLKDDVYRKSAEIGYWLAQPYWKKGVMSRAIAELCTLAFERCDICRIFAEPFAHNAGSRRALEKAGFVLEGVLRKSVYKNGAICDSCVYALVK